MSAADAPSGPAGFAASGPGPDRPTIAGDRSTLDRRVPDPAAALPSRPPVGVAPEAALPRTPDGPRDEARTALPNGATGATGTDRRDDRPLVDGPAPDPAGRGPGPNPTGIGAMATCTAPQLRRFIKSRPYVPMHELRRRFGINGGEDDVSSIELGDHRRVFVGLPPREGSLLGELLRAGDIGYELSLDPRTPVVIGLYPMRPVARS